MSHQRKTIRDAVVNLLKNASTVAGQNVYPNRETLLWESELPAILVYTKEETADPRDVSSRQSIRTLQLVIECKVHASTTVDNDLDALANEVETVISLNPNLAGSALSIIYRSTEITLDVSSDTEKASASMIYDVRYIK